jgi:hypothetical protein
MSHKEVINSISKGYRLPQPRLMESAVGEAGMRLYDVCLQCWHQRPELRPLHADVVANLKAMVQVRLQST